MNIYMWSGPRNLSTALMRSFENRFDTNVWDEPLYAYYLKKTKKKHPICKEIISKYETKIGNLIKLIKASNNKEIFYQKHMTHHILKETPIDWIQSGINCFLIRDPKDVLNSYIKQNKMTEANDIGFPMQGKIFNLVKNFDLTPIVINADDLSLNPKKVLKILCNKLNIPFMEKMLKWPKGKRISDGIWGEIWYQNVQSSTKFIKLKKNNLPIPKKYKIIYEECMDIYNQLNTYNIINEK
jgi:hypothetical protein